MKYFLLFCGYPYSGYDLVSEILNSNPNVICDSTSIEIPYIPKREILITGTNGNKVIDLLNNNPEKLGIFKSEVGIPIKWVFVVRNPFDNLAIWCKTENKELNIIINEYIKLNEIISKLKKSEDILIVNYEYILTRMHNTLEEMASFLEISFDPVWRDNVRNTIYKKPLITRNKIKWNIKQKGIVQNIINTYFWLNGYQYGGCSKC